MSGFGPYEIVPFLLLPALLILVGTSAAIIRKPDATVEWVLGAAVGAILAMGLYALVVVSVFTLVVR